MSGTKDASSAEPAPLTLAQRLRDIALNVSSTSSIGKTQAPLTDSQLETWINNCTIVIQDLERHDSTLTISSDPQWLFTGLISPRINSSILPQLYRLVYQKGPVENTVPILQVDGLEHSFWHLRGVAKREARRIVGQLTAPTNAVGSQA